MFISVALARRPSHKVGRHSNARDVIVMFGMYVLVTQSIDIIVVFEIVWNVRHSYACDVIVVFGM